MPLPPVRVLVHHPAKLDREAWRLHREWCDFAAEDAVYVGLEDVVEGPRAPSGCSRCYPDTTLLLSR